MRPFSHIGLSVARTRGEWTYCWYAGDPNVYVYPTVQLDIEPTQTLDAKATTIDEAVAAMKGLPKGER